MDFSHEGGRNRLWLVCRFTEYGDSGIRAKRRNGGITTDGTTPPEDQDGEDRNMLMSDMAVRELENHRDTFFDSCRRAFLSVFGRSSDHRLPRQVEQNRAYMLRSLAPATPAPEPITRAGSMERTETADSPQPWRRHPQLRAAPTAALPSTSGRRSARLEAERGMILARGGKFADATAAFITAASDPKVDLTALPGFWDLSRQGMASAARAYEHNSRIRDAAALKARMRSTLRPRAIKPLPAASPNRMTASGY